MSKLYFIWKIAIRWQTTQSCLVKPTLKTHESLKKEKEKQKRQELKKNLPSICFSGTFRERSAKKIIKHSGLVCLDFDDFKKIYYEAIILI